MGYVAFVLDEQSRKRLLETYPPKYGKVIARSVTLEFGVNEEAATTIAESYSDGSFCTVRGYASNEAADCVAVVVGNWKKEQPTGTPFHITLSVADGHTPVEADTAARLVTNPVGDKLLLTGTIQYCE